MSKAVAIKQNSQALEQVIMRGDLAQLSEDQKLQYMKTICEMTGLNPLTQPFDFIKFQGQLKMYARKDCAEQLRKIHGVSIVSLEPKQIGDLFVVTVRAKDKTGKEDMATGALNIANLKGEALANAMMKTETKAKRRVTLSICGLGILDESEIEGASAEQSSSEPDPFDKEAHAKTVETLLAKYRKLGVTEAQIRNAVNLSSDCDITDLNADQIIYLNECGSKIKNKRATISELFPVEPVDEVPSFDPGDF